MINDWLKLLCQLLPEVTYAVVVRQAKQSIMASWPDGDWATQEWATQDWADRGGPAGALAANAKHAPDDGSCAFIPAPGGPTHVVCKLNARGLTLGTLCLELPLNRSQFATTEHLILWSKAWLELLLRNARERATGFENLLATLSQASAFDSLRENTYALSTNLVQQFGLAQVVICMMHKGRFVTQAVSNVPAFEGKAEQFFLLEKSLCWREGALHLGEDYRHWLQAQKPALEVECLPIVHGGHCYGAVICTWPIARDLEPHSKAQLRTIVRHIAPIFASQAQLKEPLHWRAINRARKIWQRLSQTHKTLAIALPILLLLLLVLAPVTYKVKGQATLEGLVQRAIVAPEDGYLLQADVRAGELLKKDQIIARLDQKSILLEIKRWQSEKQEYEGQFNRELNALNHTQMRIAKAKVAQAEAKLDLYKDRLQRLTITAPIDGIIIKGDLSRAVGSPVERGQVLYEMAPLNEFKLVIMVDESRIRHLRPGQSGRLVLAAFPSDAMVFTVNSVASVFENQQEGVFYRVEAELAHSAEHLRPGMSGIAKVEVGRKPLGWVVIYPLWRWLRLQLWSV